MHHFPFCPPPKFPVAALSMPVPASTVPGVDSLLDFVGPHPRHYSQTTAAIAITGAIPDCWNLLRPEFMVLGPFGHLDAPEFIARGSIESSNYRSFTMANHTVSRE